MLLMSNKEVIEKYSLYSFKIECLLMTTTSNSTSVRHKVKQVNSNALYNIPRYF